MRIAACSATSISTATSPRNAGMVWTPRLGDRSTPTTASSRRPRPGRVRLHVGGDDATWGTLVDNLHVLPGLKGRGIGRRLLEAAAHETRRRFPDDGIYLFVFEANAAARRFYASVGGREVERRGVEPPGRRNPRRTGASCGTTRSGCWRRWRSSGGQSGRDGVDERGRGGARHAQRVAPAGDQAVAIVAGIAGLLSPYRRVSRVRRSCQSARATRCRCGCRRRPSVGRGIDVAARRPMAASRSGSRRGRGNAPALAAVLTFAAGLGLGLLLASAFSVSRLVVGRSARRCSLSPTSLPCAVARRWTATEAD